MNVYTFIHDIHCEFVMNDDDENVKVRMKLVAINCYMINVIVWEGLTIFKLFVPTFMNIPRVINYVCICLKL